MADDKAVGAPALDMNIESGNFDEKRAQPPAEAVPPKKDASAEDEEEDEDIDALIEDLESEDGHAFEEEEEETSPSTGGRVVPDDMLQTDSRLGLTEAEVVARRRKYGLNQMKEEKENLVLKFLGFFVGPIQFVMEVSFFFLHLHGPMRSIGCFSPLRRFISPSFSPTLPHSLPTYQTVFPRHGLPFPPMPCFSLFRAWL